MICQVLNLLYYSKNMSFLSGYFLSINIFSIYYSEKVYNHEVYQYSDLSTDFKNNNKLLSCLAKKSFKSFTYNIST